MKQERKQQDIRKRRAKRVRSRVIGTQERPRLSVKRTLKHTEAQIIDDVKQVTLVSVHDREVAMVKAEKGQTINIARAYAVGKLIADIAKKQKISRVVFDRRQAAYHGRVAACAQGARDGGLEF